MVKAPVKEETRLSGCEIVSKYNWDYQTARAVCMAESGGNHLADNTGLNSNGTNDKGLFQINSIHVTSGLIGDNERLNPDKNVEAAYAIYKGSGWNAWVAYKSGAYLKYL